jgi:UDP-N-acetylenolpyruvoylglucosamine reductase
MEIIMNTKPITESEYAPLRISALPSRPTASSAFGGKGYTATQLKAAFDRLPLLLIERFNRLLSDIESTGAGSLAADLPTGIEDGHTLADFFEDVKSGTLATYLGVGGRSLAEALDKAEATLGEMEHLIEDAETGKLATYLAVDGDLSPQTRDSAAHDFSYRYSRYLSRPNEMITEAIFRLRRGDRDEIHRKMLSLMEQRRAKQPLEYPSAGSFYKRPVGAFAGKLIEDCGLKGYTVGGAQISEKHAGFVINRGGATEADIRRLSQEVRRIVFEKTGYLLECEIRPMTGDPI